MISHISKANINIFYYWGDKINKQNEYDYYIAYFKFL